MNDITLIKVSVTGSILTVPQKVLTVAGTKGLIKVQFNFDTEWADYINKQAIFKNGSSTTTVDIFSNTIDVPPSILAKAGMIEMSVVGKVNTPTPKVKRTETRPVLCQLHTITRGTNEIEVTPDQYTQFIEEMTKEIEKVLNLKVSAVTLDSGQQAYVIRGTTPEGEVTLTFGLPRGLKGDDGRSFVVKGGFPTLEDLKAAHPTGSVGDAYIVGTPLQDLYMWNPEAQPAPGWAYVDHVVGPQGPQGVPGPQGEPGEPGEQGEPGPKGDPFIILGSYPSLTALIEAHPVGNKGDMYAVGEPANQAYFWNTETLEWTYLKDIIGPQGPQGVPGYTPQRGIDYWTEEDKEEVIASVAPNLALISTDQNVITLNPNTVTRIIPLVNNLSITLNAPEQIRFTEYKVFFKGTVPDISVNITVPDGYTLQNFIEPLDFEAEVVYELNFVVADDNIISVNKVCHTKLKVYSVTWPATGTTDEMTRGDDAAAFPEPNPYYAGMEGTPSSPFDNIMPWAGMEEVEDPDLGTLVKIPKFYFKVEKDPSLAGYSKLSISPLPLKGYYIDPMHAERGDGKGERNFVYVGKYRCAANTFKSAPFAQPSYGINPDVMTENIKAMKEGAYPVDWAYFTTIWMLAAVEFANANPFYKISSGGGPCTVAWQSVSKANIAFTASGGSATIPYHTGTTQASRETDDPTPLYRHIESLNANGWEYLAGFRIYALNSGTSSDYADYFGITQDVTKYGTLFTHTLETPYLSGGTPRQLAGFSIKMDNATPCLVFDQNKSSNPTFSSVKMGKGFMSSSNHGARGMKVNFGRVSSFPNDGNPYSIRTGKHIGFLEYLSNSSSGTYRYTLYEYTGGAAHEQLDVINARLQYLP